MQRCADAATLYAWRISESVRRVCVQRAGYHTDMTHLLRYMYIFEGAEHICVLAAYTYACSIFTKGTCVLCLFVRGKQL
jgi:hypothetical protein